MNIFSYFRLSNSASFSELQYLASRRAAAVAASILPPSTASETTLQPPPTHQHDFHPAYRIPGYMEHLYSLHNATSPSASLHGQSICKKTFSLKIIFMWSLPDIVHENSRFEKTSKQEQELQERKLNTKVEEIYKID